MYQFLVFLLQKYILRYSAFGPTSGLDLPIHRLQFNAKLIWINLEWDEAKSRGAKRPRWQKVWAASVVESASGAFSSWAFAIQWQSVGKLPCSLIISTLLTNSHVLTLLTVQTSNLHMCIELSVWHQLVAKTPLVDGETAFSWVAEVSYYYYYYHYYYIIAGWQELRKRRLTKSLDSDENFKPYLVKKKLGKN